MPATRGHVEADGETARRERIGFGDTWKRSTSRRAGGVSWPMLIGPLPLGQPVTGASVMTAVGADVSVSSPIALRAVTRTRSVLPTSACLATYVLAVAPLIDEHLRRSSVAAPATGT